MTCNHLIAGVGPLVCTIDGPHRTHVYVSTNASHLGEGAHHREPEGDSQ